MIIRTPLRPLVATALVLAAAVALADPPLHRAPGFSLEGTSGRTRRLDEFSGRIVIVVYEDRDAVHQNDALKSDLAARARAGNVSRDVVLLPIANLAGLRFWPAEGFARGAVVDTARQQNVEILIDWTGDVGRAYGFPPRRSGVAILGRDRRVLFRESGTLSPTQRQRFFEILTAATAQP